MKIGKVDFEPIIDKGIPLTQREDCWFSIFKKMNDTDSFLIPNDILINYGNITRLRQIIIKAGIRMNIKITTRLTKEGLRIWKNIFIFNKA